MRVAAAAAPAVLVHRTAINPATGRAVATGGRQLCRSWTPRRDGAPRACPLRGPPVALCTVRCCVVRRAGTHSEHEYQKRIWGEWAPLLSFQRRHRRIPAMPYVSMQRRTGDVADSTPGTESFSGGVAVADHAVLPRREGGMALARAMSTDLFFFFKKKQRCSVLSITSSIIWFLECVA